jgi:putative tryptophan/tyrosine transport system substrate-binding protein
MSSSRLRRIRPKLLRAPPARYPLLSWIPATPSLPGSLLALRAPAGTSAPDLATKRLEILKETAPKIYRVLILFNATIPPAEVAMKEMTAAAPVLGLQVQSVPVQGPTGFDDAFGMVTRDHAEGLVVFADPLTFSHQQLIVDFAAKTRIAAMFAAREFVDIGGLMSYGPSYPGMFRRGAYYVDRILRGTKPADLPVEQPTKFELVINLKTAKALGLEVPPALLTRADEVIE